MAACIGRESCGGMSWRPRPAGFTIDGTGRSIGPARVSVVPPSREHGAHVADRLRRRVRDPPRDPVSSGVRNRPHGHGSARSPGDRSRVSCSGPGPYPDLPARPVSLSPGSSCVPWIGSTSTVPGTWSLPLRPLVRRGHRARRRDESAILLSEVPVRRVPGDHSRADPFPVARGSPKCTLSSSLAFRRCQLRQRDLHDRKEGIHHGRNPLIGVLGEENRPLEGHPRNRDLHEEFRPDFGS